MIKMTSKIAVCAFVALALAVTAQNSNTNQLRPVWNDRGRVRYYVAPNNRVQKPIRPIPIKDYSGNVEYYQVATPGNRELVAVSPDVLANSRPIPVRNPQGRVVYQAIPRPDNNGLLAVDSSDLLRIQLDVSAKINATVQADINATLKVRSLQDTWNKLKEKFRVVIEKVKVEFEKVKEKSTVQYKKIMKNISVMKEAGLELLEKARKTVKEFVAHGKCVYVDFMSLYDTVKDAYENVKPAAKDVVHELKEVVNELKKTAINGQLLVEIKKE